MVSAARTVAYDLLYSIEQNYTRSDDAIHSRAVGRLPPRDRNLVTEIIYGTLRWQGLLDYILAQLCSRPLEKVCPGGRILLRMGLYQMWKMDRIPDHALVNDAVEIAKARLERGTGGFINGVLRNALRRRPWEEKRIEQECPQWSRVSLPRWLWERWAHRFGIQQAREFAISLNEPPAEAIRVGPNETLDSRGAGEMRPSDLVPGAFIRVRAETGASRQDFGRLAIQDEASQLIPYLLGPCGNWYIWDACAAPGGKSAILRNQIGIRGFVISSDYRLRRAQQLAHTLGSFGGTRSYVIVADAAQRPPFRTRFDAVLADVPCSGLGTLRRNPEIKWRFSPERLCSLHEQQLKILEAVSAAVKSGGRLLYSTCSTEPEENEQVIEAFLASHPEFHLQRPNHPPGIEAWISATQYMRTFPSQQMWDGFFAALMVRKS